MSKYADVLSDERVILLDSVGQPRGSASKRTVHGPDTPLHLGFSCHLVDRRGRVLLTRRAATKPTWPGTWSNGCCGHPRPGETLRAAVTRRLWEELGLTPRSMGLAISDFTYRAVMDDGTVEHEVCPVLVAEVDTEPSLNPAEVDDASWVDWSALCDRAQDRPTTLSPWSVGQITQLRRLAPSPWTWLQCGGDLRRLALDATIGEGALPSGPSTTAGDALGPIRGPVEAVLRRFLSTRARELCEVDPALTVVAREVSDLVSAGGKRLRPAFVYWGHRAAGADHDPAVAQVAAAVEMLHSFALLHDDVMDKALTRRGRPVASRGFTRAHEEDRLEGDSEWFGTSAAILAGDLAFVWADQLLEGASLDHVTMSRVREVFTALRVELMAGQYLDLRLDGATCADPDAARQVAVLKSGRYTVTRPLELGLATAAARPDSRVQRALASYGDAIGLAFQLRDDVLGLFGDPSATGKGNTDDLRAGKRTLLMLRALALATPAHGTFLARSLGDRDLTDEDIERCREIVEHSGALASVETLLRHQRAAALDALTDVPEPAKGALVALASMAVERNH